MRAKGAEPAAVAEACSKASGLDGGAIGEMDGPRRPIMGINVSDAWRSVHPLKHGSWAPPSAERQFTVRQKRRRVICLGAGADGRIGR
jgi:hypothetical protein